MSLKVAFLSFGEMEFHEPLSISLMIKFTAIAVTKKYKFRFES